MNLIFRFPKAARFGKHIPKSKVYTHASSGKRVRNLFVKEVEKITWAYKLSPQTVNIPAGENTREIQILSISLRTPDLSHEVLRAIDKSIPSPVLFSLEYKNQNSYAAAYKRPSEADKTKWVIGSYFETERTNNSEKKTELPIVLNMDELYFFFLKELIPIRQRETDTIRTLVERAEAIIAKERQAAKIEGQVKREKQFNRKVELNHELNKLNTEIEKLRKAL